MPEPHEDKRTLTPAVEKRLYPYVLAAGASLLAAAKPADAGVIYVNPIDQTYTNTGFSLDLNNDGAPDVTFAHFVPHQYARSLWVNAAGGVLLNEKAKAAALPQSAWIGPGGNFGANAKMAYAWVYGGAWGPWANVPDAYLGLRFQIGSNTHYGWVRMGVSMSDLSISATVRDWAYEDRPDTAIHASGPAVVPEPGTLSLLALGAAGLALWRRRKAQAR